MTQTQGILAAVACAGIAGGLLLLARGLLAHLSATRVRGIGTSQVESLAAGEVRLVGTVEPGVMTLVSPLQGVPCVYYRAKVTEDRGRIDETILAEERAIGFLLRDPTGSIRVFPRGARWDAEIRFSGRTGWAGDEPPGLNPNAGPALWPSVVEREAAIADLLTVHPATTDVEPEEGGFLGGGLGLGAGKGLGGLGTRRRTYEERRIEPGEKVTVIGAALPFRDLPDPAGADRWDPLAGLDDPEVAASIAEARAAGTLAADPRDAWGNAAIPGFGIGRPTRAPALDPDAKAAVLATAEEAAAAPARMLDIAPDALVVGAAEGVSIAILAGSPGEATERAESRFFVGLAGALLAIGSAILLALVVDGRIGT